MAVIENDVPPQLTDTNGAPPVPVGPHWIEVTTDALIQSLEGDCNQLMINMARVSSHDAIDVREVSDRRLMRNDVLLLSMISFNKYEVTR